MRISYPNTSRPPCFTWGRNIVSDCAARHASFTVLQILVEEIHVPGPEAGILEGVENRPLHNIS